MGRSQETFGKKEREKKKQKRKKDKAQQREERKAQNEKKSFDDMIAYVDEFGNISDTPPDPTKKKKIKAEDIVIGVPPKDEMEEEDTVRQGVVTTFKDDRGFGFIKDLSSQESIFFHVNGTIDEVGPSDKVTFEVEMTPKGPNAVRVKLAE